MNINTSENKNMPARKMNYTCFVEPNSNEIHVFYNALYYRVEIFINTNLAALCRLINI